LKVCSCCREEKPFEFFAKLSRSKSGLDVYCKSCRKVKKSTWYKNNKEHADNYGRDYYKNNLGFRERLKIVNAEYQKEKRTLPGFKTKKNSRESKRRAAKFQATPAWLSNEQQKEIENFYWLAQDLKCISGQTYHVDHIVPLQSKKVCGLHVPWNLQILPSEINLSKSNRV
jgi:5-methylcytosine-specific restriction endonuclease McrA